MRALAHAGQFCLNVLELLGRVVYWSGFAMVGVVVLVLLLAALNAAFNPPYAVVVYTKGDMVVPEWYWSYTQCQQDSLLKYPAGGCVDTTDEKWTFVERYR